eukprot:3304672-Rhodomonas_salina.2
MPRRRKKEKKYESAGCLASLRLGEGPQDPRRTYQCATARGRDSESENRTCQCPRTTWAQNTTEASNYNPGTGGTNYSAQNTTEASITTPAGYRPGTLRQLRCCRAVVTKLLKKPLARPGSPEGSWSVTVREGGSGSVTRREGA